MTDARWYVTGCVTESGCVTGCDTGYSHICVTCAVNKVMFRMSCGQYEQRLSCVKYTPVMVLAAHSDYHGERT